MGTYALIDETSHTKSRKAAAVLSNCWVKVFSKKIFVPPQVAFDLLILRRCVEEPPVHILRISRPAFLDVSVVKSAEFLQTLRPRSEEHTSELQSQSNIV